MVERKKVEHTKCYCQVENDCHEVAKSEGSIFPHVSQDEDAHDLPRKSEPDLQQGIPQPLSSEDTSLFLGMGSKHTLPQLQTHNQILKP